MSTSEQNFDVHLHAEIEVLKNALVDKQTQLIAMETTCLNESDRQVELEDSIIAWQDKYDRLYESHKRVQKVNQNLEDKLLKLVDRNSGERAQLTSDVATLSVRLAQANYNIATLQREIERYKTDMGLAIQLLQCKPDSFVSQKVTSLPLEIQSKVAQYMRLDTNSHSDSEGSISGVGVATAAAYRVLPASDSPPPLCPFPPTAMVYSMRGIDDSMATAVNTPIDQSDPQMISPQVMAKYLEDELKTSEIKHCDTCLCANRDLTVLADTSHSYNASTQTVLLGDSNNSLCLRCNSNLNSPSRTNSPYIMKLVKSSDSIISESKSSVSGSNFNSAKKDDLMVNPILGHHRLCDRTSKPNLDNSVSTIVDQLVDSATTCDINGALAPPLQPIQTAVKPMSYNNGNIHSPMQIKMRSPSQQSSSQSFTFPKQAPSSPPLQHDNFINSNYNNCAHKSKQTVNEASQKKNNINNCTNRNNIELQQAQMNKVDHRSSLQQHDAVSGSTNSIWSKTSSNVASNPDGAKLFENFNRNLIKSIKADNKVLGPRLCALRIQNGTSNILLDNIESTLSPVVYTRRSRFLDEELDETKDIITSPGNRGDASTCTTTATDMLLPLTNISMVMSTTQTTSCGYGLNKTDYEKYREVNSNDISSLMTSISPNIILNDVLSNSNMNISTTTTAIPNSYNNNNNHHTMNNEHIVRFNQQHGQQLNLDKLENETLSSSRNVNLKSCTQSSSISSELDIQESALLRRQQLTRVAEWVQNNHMDNQSIDPMLSSQSASSLEANSTDSGYKTKTNTNNINHINNINNNNDIVVVIDSDQPFGENCYGDPKAIDRMEIKSTTNLVMSISDDKKLVGNDFAQNLNTNFNQQTTNQRFENNNLQNNELTNCDYGLKMLINSNSNSNNSNNAQIDLAQMEYNVKQFLLKQNEWSIHNNRGGSCVVVVSGDAGNVGCVSESVDNNIPLSSAPNARPFLTTSAKINPQRTETNL